MSDVPIVTGATAQTSPDTGQTHTLLIMNEALCSGKRLNHTFINSNQIRHAAVKRRAADHKGRPLGKANANPLLDHCQCQVKHSDGQMETLMANAVTQNAMEQMDEDGNVRKFMLETEAHQSDETTILTSEGTHKTPSGNMQNEQTTGGWKSHIRWKDGSGDWVELKDLKDLHPVQLANYAIENQVHNEQALTRWMPCVQKKRRKAATQKKSNPSAGLRPTNMGQKCLEQ